MNDAIIEILKVAQHKEEKAIETYTRLLNMVIDQDIKNTLEKLANFEKEHKILIDEVLNDFIIEKIGNFETDEIEHITSIIDDDKITANSSINEIINYAIREEDRASILYEKMGKIFKKEEVIYDLTCRLAREELKHKEILEEMLKKI